MSEHPIAVIAGNAVQFHDYVKKCEDGLRRIYIDGPNRLLGTHFSKVEYIGTWYEREDGYALADLAKRRLREPT